MLKTSKLMLASALAGLIACNALAVPAGSGTTSGTTTTPAHAPRSHTIDMTQDCAGGGTRKVAGSFDATSGALSMTTTLTACVLRNGDTLDGGSSTTGTLLVGTTGTTTIDITANIDTTANRADGSAVTHRCALTKVGSFNEATKTFDGTTTRSNCSVSGKVREHENMIEHLLRAATGGDENGGSDAGQRMMPPQAGEVEETTSTQIPHAQNDNDAHVSNSRPTRNQLRD